MTIHYNLEKLKYIISNISTVTKTSILVLDHQKNQLFQCIHDEEFCQSIQAQKIGKLNCLHSDAELLLKCSETQNLVSHICHAGLCDFAMPIRKNGMTVGYIIIGRIRSTLSPDEICDRLFWTNDSTEEIKERYEKVTIFSPEQITSLGKLITHTLLENAIEIETDDFMITAIDYIDQHIQEDLSLSVLCTHLYASKNYLYKRFRSQFGCTVNEYITSQRMKKAQTLLAESYEPIYRIAEMIGLPNSTHFCNLFKTKTGMSPTEYRKLFNNREVT